MAKVKNNWKQQGYGESEQYGQMAFSFENQNKKARYNRKYVEVFSSKTNVGPLMIVSYNGRGLPTRHFKKKLPKKLEKRIFG